MAASRRVVAPRVLALFVLLAIGLLLPLDADGRCRVRRTRARLHDTAASLAQRFHLSESAFRARNGLGRGQALVHRRKYVVSDAAMGEALRDGISMGPSTDAYLTVSPDRAYGQPFVIALLRYAARTVQRHFPRGHRVVIEDISLQRGGCMSPHLEHRGGREADVGLYLRTAEETGRLRRATPATLDARRQFVLLRTLLQTRCVERILLDRRLIPPLRAMAQRSDLPLDDRQRFFGPMPDGGRSVLRAAAGHDNHTHIRFREGGACTLPKALGGEAVLAPFEDEPLEPPDDPTPSGLDAAPPADQKGPSRRADEPPSLPELPRP